MSFTLCLSIDKPYLLFSLCHWVNISSTQIFTTPLINTKSLESKVHCHFSCDMPYRVRFQFTIQITGHHTRFYFFSISLREDLEPWKFRGSKAFPLTTSQGYHFVIICIGIDLWYSIEDFLLIVAKYLIGNIYINSIFVNFFIVIQFCPWYIHTQNYILCTRYISASINIQDKYFLRKHHIYMLGKHRLFRFIKLRGNLL